MVTRAKPGSLEGFEGEKNSDFLQELMGLAGVTSCRQGLA